MVLERPVNNRSQRVTYVQASLLEWSAEKDLILYIKKTIFTFMLLSFCVSINCTLKLKLTLAEFPALMTMKFLIFLSVN